MRYVYGIQKGTGMSVYHQVQNGKILIVDDNPDNILILEDLLMAAGFNNLKSITDPRETKAVYQDFQPDLVLLDLDMPYLDGFQVMDQLKEFEFDSYIPVLIFTADTDQLTRIQALASGARDFINKPFEQAEAINRIRNAMEVRLLQKQIKGQNVILEQKVRERTRELRETRLEIIRRLGQAAEYRDTETGLHIIRMSKMCAVLGKASGMNEAQCELLLNASPMHDVGKIGIPDKILLKPGKLDADEWMIMKTHPVIGGELLSGHPDPLMVMARLIALTHHKKWDGSGYPDGLKGEDIPIEGRICALCDVFDALTSVRPYKKAWSVEDAVDEINRLSGTHFDPKLTSLFNEVLSEMVSLKKRYADNSQDNEKFTSRE